MIKAVCFGIGAGAGIQLWRQWPPDGPGSARAVIVGSILVAVLAYVAGRLRRGGNATATAVAVANATSHATAQQTVQIAVVTPGNGARPYAMRVPTEQAPWLGGLHRATTPDELDGQDVGELMESRDTALDYLRDV